jgi:mono/diheme cytochrome c family protein
MRVSHAIALTLSLAFGASPLAATEQRPMVDVVLPDSLTAEAALGRMTFAAQCAQCHGQNGAGNAGFGPPLIHKIYEPSHHGDYSFVLAVTRGVRSHHWRFGDMAPVEGMTEDRVAPIITFIREVQRANGIN